MNLKGKLAIAGQPIGSGGASSWDDLTGKPFSTVDTEGGLTIQDDTLMIDTLDHIATIDYVDHQIAEISDPSWDDIQNKPTFATVATSGDYEDLSNKPTIPSIDGLATEQYVDDAIADIDIPTNVSELNNDAGYITNSALSGYATETYVDNAVDGITTTLETDYATKAELPAATSDLTNDSGFITASALTPYAESADLAAVATSGSYNDLADKPTIPQPTSVTVTQTLSSGTAIADIDVDGVTTTLYAPAGGGTAVTPNWNATSGQDGYIDNKPNVYAGKDNTSVIISNTNATDYVSAATYSLVIGQKQGTGTGKGALDAIDSGLIIGRKYGNYGGWIGAYHSALAIGEVDSTSSAAADDVEAYYGSIAIKGQKGADVGKKTTVNAKNGSFAAGVATYNGKVKAQDGSIAFGQAGTAATGSNATEIHAEKYSLAGGRALYIGNTSRHGVYAGYNPETSSAITNGGAFAFGINTRAYKDASSALGYGTEAQSESQTALGKYNIVDSASTYNFIVGNGTAHASRSNSFAAGSDGNIYTAGSLYANVSDWSNPTTSGTKIAVIPDCPTDTDGTYVLQATVSSGAVTYSWVAQS